MAVKIKQGDAVSVPVEIELNNEDLDIAEIEEVEFYLGGFRKVYPGDVTYDTTNKLFYIPVTQEESFSWPENTSITVDARVKFKGGNVQGAEKQRYMTIIDAVSEEVL